MFSSRLMLFQTLLENQNFPVGRGGGGGGGAGGRCF